MSENSPEKPEALEWGNFLRHHIPVSVETVEVVIVRSLLTNKPPSDFRCRGATLVYRKCKDSEDMMLIAAHDDAWGEPDKHLFVTPPTGKLLQDLTN